MSTTYVDETMASNRASLPPGMISGQVSNGSAIPTTSGVAKRIHREVRFGNYILGSTLGEGEFGKVKLGWRKDGKQPSQVAIKLIKRDSIMKDSDSEIKVHREINSLKLLNHPNIVNLVEVMKSGKYIGIVLEYASGGELFDYILHHKYLKENVAKKLFAQLVSGVDYMHSKGLIHRDLKLENLLLDKHKNVIISDFGFVNSYNKDKNDFMKTSCGSPCYAAPELVLTQSPYEGRKVDIWSLGVILYAMLSGYLPFDDDSENEDGADIVRLYHYICKTPLTFPEYVSPLARDLLRKIIVPDPKRRINMNEIRNHPWLTPHVNLLSIRQPEWDRIHKENIQPPTTATQQANKRFSMLNERTNSSALMPKRGRSNSSTATNITNAMALPISTSSLAISSDFDNHHLQQPQPKHSEQPQSQPLYLQSTTPSPTKEFIRGHTKSASMSATIPSSSSGYTSAAGALKAVVNENNNNFKRNSISSINSITSNNSVANYPLSRTSTYNGGAISTIVESPTKAYLRNPLETNKTTTSAAAAAAISAAASAARQQQSQQPSDFISLLPTRAGYSNTARLPHSEKKPRPTSYHPSSMTSSLISNSNGGSSSGLFDYMLPMNLPTIIPQFLSTSPTKSPPTTTADSVRSGSSTDNSNHNGSPSSAVKSSRRNSVITPIHVNGVLTSETSNLSHDNKNSVLSYLEDKIEGLELSDQHSPIKENHSTESKPQQSVPVDGPIMGKSRPISQNVESLIPNVVEEFKTERARQKQQQLDKEKVETQTEVIPRVREDKDKDKENKKRNRFSILSFYSTYNSSSNNIADQVKPPANSSTATSSSTPKKILEPSSEVNIAQKEKEKRRVGSAGSSKSTASKKSVSSSSTASNVNSGKEASAARKVMDFFKRRSVRIG